MFAEKVVQQRDELRDRVAELERQLKQPTPGTRNYVSVEVWESRVPTEEDIKNLIPELTRNSSFLKKILWVCSIKKTEVRVASVVYGIAAETVGEGRCLTVVHRTDVELSK